MFKSKKSNNNSLGEAPDLEDLRIRRKSLANCLAHARTEVDAAHEARRKMLLAGDVNDAGALTAANDRIVAAQHTEAGFEDAIEKIDVMITDARRQVHGFNVAGHEYPPRDATPHKAPLKLLRPEELFKMRKSYWRPPIIKRNRWEREKDARDDAEAARAQAENREPSLTEMLAKNRCIAVAFHEAGHAVVAVALGQPANEIVVNDDGSGYIWHVPAHKRDITGERAKKALDVYRRHKERAMRSLTT